MDYAKLVSNPKEKNMDPSQPTPTPPSSGQTPEPAPAANNTPASVPPAPAIAPAPAAQAPPTAPVKQPREVSTGKQLTFVVIASLICAAPWFRYYSSGAAGYAIGNFISQFGLLMLMPVAAAISAGLLAWRLGASKGLALVATASLPAFILLVAALRVMPELEELRAALAALVYMVVFVIVFAFSNREQVKQLWRQNRKVLGLLLLGFLIIPAATAGMIRIIRLQPLPEPKLRMAHSRLAGAKWAIRTNGYNPSYDVLPTDDSVYVSTVDRVYALNASDGRPKWAANPYPKHHYQHDDYHISHPLLVNGLIYYSASGGGDVAELFAVDVASGQHRLANFQPVPRASVWEIYVMPKLVVIDTKKFVALKADGSTEELWSLVLEEKDNDAELYVFESDIYVVSKSIVRKLDPATGRELWQVAADPACNNIYHFAADQTRAYAACTYRRPGQDRQERGINPAVRAMDKTTGRTVWQRGRTTASELRLANDLLLETQAQSVLDPATGADKFRLPGHATFLTSRGDKLYFQSHEYFEPSGGGGYRYPVYVIDTASGRELSRHLYLKYGTIKVAELGSTMYFSENDEDGGGDILTAVSKDQFLDALEAAPAK